MKKILITGPDGFVGTALCTELLKRGFAVRGAQWQETGGQRAEVGGQRAEVGGQRAEVRGRRAEGRGQRSEDGQPEVVVVGDINGSTDWSAALDGIDTIIHLAARVHIMNDTATDPLAAFREVNVDGTRHLAEAAGKAGVRRFVLMSTIKVNGEKTDCRPQTADNENRNWKLETGESSNPAIAQSPHTHPQTHTPTNSSSPCPMPSASCLPPKNPPTLVSSCLRGSPLRHSPPFTLHRLPFTESSPPAPEDPYGISKWEAEQALAEIAAASGMETVIVRAPLIYGPGVKGNMQSLLKLAATGWPLPLGAVHNQRSLLSLGNLTDFLARCIDHPAAANETFLLSDNQDLSTTELLRKMRQAMGKPPRLIPVPPALFHLAGRLTGKSAVVDRLFGSLQVDCSKARTLLDWQPPFTVEQGIREMARGEGMRDES